MQPLPTVGPGRKSLTVTVGQRWTSRRTVACWLRRQIEQELHLSDSLIYTSTDGGDTWSTAWSASHVWKSVAISDDGNQMLAVEDFGFVHISQARTTLGVTGSISGTMSDAAELIYIGDGVFGLVSEKGDLTIR